MSNVAKLVTHRGLHVVKRPSQNYNYVTDEETSIISTPSSNKTSKAQNPQGKIHLPERKVLQEPEPSPHMLSTPVSSSSAMMQTQRQGHTYQTYHSDMHQQTAYASQDMIPQAMMTSASTEYQAINEVNHSQANIEGHHQMVQSLGVDAMDIDTSNMWWDQSFQAMPPEQLGFLLGVYPSGPVGGYLYRPPRP